MTMKTTLLAASLAATLAVQPVLAGGPVAAADEPSVAADAVTPDWSGLHLGLAAARPNGDNAWAERGAGVQSDPGDFSGTLPTLSAGYDWQRGNLVYGVTLSISGGDISANPVSGGGFGCGGCEFTVDKFATLRGRLGWSLGKTLVYGTAGLARAHGQGTTAGGTTIHGEDNLTGWAAGLGVERYVGSKITISAEYLQTDLGRMELPDSCSTQCYTDVSFGLMQLGVNYRW